MTSEPLNARAAHIATSEMIRGNTNAQLFVRTWRPHGEVRGVVAIVPGFKSNSSYYEWVATQFVATGLAVYAVDLRGRGKSDGDRFYVERLEDYLNDIGALVSLAKSRERDRPLFLLGHSAGGVLASTYALDNQVELTGLICESYALEVPAPPFALSAIKALARIAPRLKVLKLNNAGFSRDPRRVEFMDKDPLLQGEIQPARTVAQMLRAAARLRREFQRITLPVFIMHGTKDSVTKPSGSRLFHERAGSTDKTLKLYEGHFHDLLNDIDREKVMADIQGWIKARIPARPSESRPPIPEDKAFASVS
jgi:acylglycerol lipase